MSKLIVDTNILQYGVSDHYAKDVRNLIKSFVNDNEEMYISSYTTFEIYRGIDSKKIEKTKKIVDVFTSIPPDLVTFKIAAVLTTCYQRHDATKVYASKYADGDTIIAASAIRDQSRILTANVNDFPAPFFQEEKRYYITSTITHVKIPVSIVRPDYEIYFNARDTHYPKD